MSSNLKRFTSDLSIKGALEASELNQAIDLLIDENVNYLVLKDHFQ